MENRYKYNDSPTAHGGAYYGQDEGVYELSNLSQTTTSYSMASKGQDPYADDVPLTKYSGRYVPGGPSSMRHDAPLPPLPPDAAVLENAPPVLERPERKRRPWVTWGLSLVQVGVFIYMLVRMAQLTGSPIATRPTFNPMVGPSTYLQINLGSRYVPCMHYIKGVTDSVDEFPCPNSTSVDDQVCSLSELCGMGGVGTHPHQWWRFITPMFLHAGFVHIIFNLALQLQSGARVESDIGHVKYIVIYLASGISGFVLGGNFSPDGVSSCGASGALFGIIAIEVLDILFNWSLYPHPRRFLLFLLIVIVLSFAIGLLPGLDNFSHIGGFCMGALLGITLLRSPLALRTDDPIYERTATVGERIKATPRLFYARKVGWYLWLLVRAAALLAAVVYMVVLIRHFNNGGGHCSWCKYLSCLPIKNWCDAGYISS
ncbi:uncharacterized protein V1510DRAFT_415818 [Dipodascopsis tothii]|uniref:uncharacterized protein n=1 Tax=Dipodascopsis tothii TaxID=44089 RepID=UPI0034CD3562